MVVKAIASYKIKPGNSEDVEFVVTKKRTTMIVSTSQNTVDDNGNMISPREDNMSTSTSDVIEEIVSVIGVQSKTPAEVYEVVYNDGIIPQEALTVEPPYERPKPISMNDFYSRDVNDRPRAIDPTSLYNR